jgi:hypothetical protein
VGPRKYQFVNLSKTETVHVKELRKALSPGKESAVWEGTLNKRTHVLVDQKLLEIKDLGPADAPQNTRQDRFRDSNRAKLRSDVSEILAKQPKPEAKGEAEAVNFDDDLEAPSADMAPEPMVTEPAPEPAPEPEPEQQPLIDEEPKTEKKSKKKK